MLITEALSRSSFWALFLSLPSTQTTEGAAKACGPFKAVPLCSHTCVTVERNESPPTVKADTYTYMFLWWQDNWHGVQAISGSAEFNYVKYPRFNSREYRGIFAFSVRCVSCVTFFEFVLTTQVKWSTCLFPVETDPLEVQRKACWSIAGVEAKLSFPPGSRPHL